MPGNYDSLYWRETFYLLKTLGFKPLFITIHCRYQRFGRILWVQNLSRIRRPFSTPHVDQGSWTWTCRISRNSSWRSPSHASSLGIIPFLWSIVPCLGTTDVYDTWVAMDAGMRDVHGFHVLHVMGIYGFFKNMGEQKYSEYLWTMASMDGIHGSKPLYPVLFATKFAGAYGWSSPHLYLKWSALR